MPSDLERAWVAGIFDGDGCITLNRTLHGRKPLIVVDNTDIEILDELTKFYGGSMVRKKRAQEHHRQAWSWRIYGADRVIAVLTEVLPFMRCNAKKERALLIMTEYKAVTPRNGWYTEELRERKRDFEERFMAIGAGRGSQSMPGQQHEPCRIKSRSMTAGS